MTVDKLKASLGVKQVPRRPCHIPHRWVGSNDASDAAVRRAGVVRVETVTQLFSAAKALSCGFHPSGNRLAIVTNGGGPGVMATDRASDLGLVMAEPRMSRLHV